MRNVIQAIRELEPPPVTTFEIGTPAAWREVERKLGLCLPPDYVALTDTYGSGMWDGGELVVLNPFTAEFCRNLVKQCGPIQQGNSTAIEAERETRKQVQELGQVYPYPIYPESGGLIPWAYTGNGGNLFWVSQGEPQSWPTAFFRDRSDEFEVIKLSVTEIILGILNGSFELYPGSERLTEEDLKRRDADLDTPLRLGFTPINPTA